MNAAIVTGVSRGLGEALVVALLARGWQVLGVGRESTWRASGPAYRFVRHDLADAAGVDAALAAPMEAVARSRPAAVCLLNNAASAGPVGRLGTLAGADIVSSLAASLAAPVALANLFCRAFGGVAADRRIVNVSSGAAVRSIAGAGVYSIAKAGLEMLTSAIAAEQGEDGIRAVSLRPGILDTRMQAFIRSHPEAVLPSAGMFREFHASGRLVQPDAAAAKIVERIVVAPIVQGRTYSYAEL